MNDSVIRGIVVLMFFLNSCEAQQKEQTIVTIQTNCNRTVYGSLRYIKLLPSYICIPDHFIIDDYARFSDIDGDGKDDFIALKYNKKADDQIDGDSTYWNFYYRSKNDTTYRLKNTLSNIVPPFIENESWSYLSKHPIAERIFETYPRRLYDHSLSFHLTGDTIQLSYKFEDTYGKRFVFVYEKNDWYLKNVEYFIGELPMYWWKENEFFYPLNDKLKVIESRRPQKIISIAQFDLKEAFKYREDEWTHLSEWHIDTIDKTKWKSIEDVVFNRCHGMELPEDWLY
jgi:hypothetical protein